jgi:biotin transport system substrate-specific component
MADRVLIEAIGPTSGSALRLKQAALVGIGILALTVCAQIKVPMWPVAINMGTFAVLSIGAAYGPRLGLATILGYMVVGALGFDVFQSSTADLNGIEYMLGGTGGYLVGYVLAILLLGMLARRGWDRTAGRMAAAMLVANAVIYVPGLLWLGQLYGWDQPILAWGLWPFLVGDALKLALAAMLLPAVWRGVAAARS